MAVRLRLTGVVPMVATTKVLVCLLRTITRVAAVVARNARSLSPSKVQLLFGFDQISYPINIGLSPLCRAMGSIKEKRRDEDELDEYGKTRWRFMARFIHL